MPPPICLDYRLSEEDVHHYCSASRGRRCWRCCRGRKAALVVLASLGLFLVGTCFRANGVRSGMLALGTTIVVLAALAWWREARFEGCVGRLARQMGIPRELHLVVTTEGIAEESDPETAGPPRIFRWSEVVEVARVDHLTVIRLRPAGGVLIVPDSAFAGPEGRAEFEQVIHAWQGAATC